MAKAKRQYQLVEVLGEKGIEGCTIRQEGFFWIVEDKTGRGSFGKTREEAINAMKDFLVKEALFEAQFN